MDARRAALIVASYEYQDPGLRRLRAPAQDAEALARVLSDPQIGDFDVRTLLNEPGHVIGEAVEEFFADRTPDDLLLLHFSCHGVKDEGGELYFAATNTKLRLLGATAVAADFVNRCMNRSRSRRVVLLLDCCYAGAFERGMLARADRGVAIEERFGGRGRAVITASSAMEYAFEGDELADTSELKPSLFTSALVEGLDTGEADRDQDGYVGLDELYDYVYDRVRERTPNQTPGKWTYGVQGDLRIARRSRPVTRPAPLPPELQQAIDHPLAGIRAGAVRELERVLQSTHAGMALAARLALERLAQDDSRTVSAAAMAALGGGGPQAAAPRPAPPELDLSAPVAGVGLEPRPPTGQGAAVAPPAEAAGETPGRAQPAWREEASLPMGPAISVPVPMSAELSVATEPANPAGAPDPGALEAGGDGRFRVAGVLAIAAAILLLVSLVPSYAGGVSAIEYTEATWHDLIVAALASAAGVFLLVLPARPLVSAGVLLGTAAAAAWGPLGDITNAVTGRFGEPGPGLWLSFVAGLIGIAGACLAGFALTRTSNVRVVPRLPEGVLPWLVALLGLAGAVVFFISQMQLQLAPAQQLWVTVMAFLVPASAAVATPRRFGAGLLAGWIGGGMAVVVFYSINLPRSGTNPAGIVAFGATLLALLLVTIRYAYTPAGSGQGAGRS